MDVTQKPFMVHEMYEAVKAGFFVRNAEYQRGVVWKLVQKQTLIDSIFRGYPVPPLFLHDKTISIQGRPSTKWEIIDGQQRLNAIVEFVDGKYHLLDRHDPKLRIPTSLRQVDTPWSGRSFADLSKDLALGFHNTALTVFEIVSNNDDEVRDLFIRLQSGTALSPQQIRDAWPGTIGPLINAIAGRFSNAGQVALFKNIDRRGRRDELEDDRLDPHVNHRQMCAQLLSWFIGRRNDPFASPPLGPEAVNGLYQEFAAEPSDSQIFRDFRETLQWTDRIFERLSQNRAYGSKTLSAEGGQKQSRKRAKFTKRDLFGIFSLIQDLSRNPLNKIDNSLCHRIADHVPPDGIPSPLDPDERFRQDAPSQLKLAYDQWRERLPIDLCTRLDPVRIFTELQKTEIFRRDQGQCKVCGQAVSEGDAEYDHFPVPYRDGGRTEINNGRLVHFTCHKRGRPVDDD